MSASTFRAAVAGEYCPLLPPHLLERRLRSGKALFTDLGLEKSCPRCLDYWPMDTEFWGGNSSSPDGLDDLCCACRSSYSMQRNAAARAALAAGEAVA